MFFIFPPFSLIPRILQKVEEDGTEAVLIAPIWTTQSCWPSLIHLINGYCYQLPSAQKILFLRNKPDTRHPLRKMNLGCFPISGSHFKKRECQQKPGTLFLSHCECPRKNSTIPTFKNGLSSAMGTLIPFDPTSMMF